MRGMSDARSADLQVLPDAVLLPRAGRSTLVYGHGDASDANRINTLASFARARRLEVNVWLEVAQEQRMRELVVLGVDGLITSDIALAMNVVRATGGEGHDR